MPTISSAQERTSIEKFVNGFPLELAKRAHAADLPKLLAGGDEAVYFASRASEFFLGGFNGPAFVKIFNDDTMISNSRQWDIVWPDGDFWKGGMMSQGLYISPDRDLVIAYFSLNAPDRSIDRFLRPIAKSKLFNK